MKKSRQKGFRKAFLIAVTAVLLSAISPNINPSKVSAENELYTLSDYAVEYTLSEGTGVTAKYTISEENVSSNQSILSRTLVVPGVVSGASATLGGSDLSTSISEQGDSTKVTVNFNRYYFGQGREITWTLTLELADEIEIKGSLRYFFLRGFIRDEHVRSYSASVVVPNSLQPMNYLSTEDYTVAARTSAVTYSFPESAFAESSILLILGEAQSYSFSFNYEVEAGYQAELVVPPDRDNQQVFFTDVSPSPTRSWVDDDGNYRLMYETTREMETSGIKIEGLAVVSPRAKEKGDNSQTLDADTKKAYLKAEKYWQADDQEIAEMANQLTEGKTSNYGNANEIYSYVKDSLTYNSDADLNTRERKGATLAMSETGDCVCQEFSDLFIALARASDIPAREVAGYAEDVLETDQDQLVLHSWVEFWDDDYGWVMADPTWANNVNGNYFNNVGSDHLVMLIRGTDSVNPSIVTSFLGTDDPSDNVTLEATSETISPLLSAELVLASEGSAAGGIPATIKNTGNQALVLQDASVKVGGSRGNYVNSGFLVLPGAQQQIPFDFDFGFLLMNTTKQVEMEATVSNYDGELLSLSGKGEITVKPALPWIIIIPAGTLGLALLLWLAIQWFKK